MNTSTQLDDTTWEVVIRDGIKWHDGEDFTAEDVKFTYEYYHNEFNTLALHIYVTSVDCSEFLIPLLRR